MPLYLDNFLHLPDLIPLEPPEQRDIPEVDEDRLYEEARDRGLMKERSGKDGQTRKTKGEQGQL